MKKNIIYLRYFILSVFHMFLGLASLFISTVILYLVSLICDFNTILTDIAFFFQDDNDFSKANAYFIIIVILLLVSNVVFILITGLIRKLTGHSVKDIDTYKSVLNISITYLGFIPLFSGMFLKGLIADNLILIIVGIFFGMLFPFTYYNLK